MKGFHIFLVFLVFVINVLFSCIFRYELAAECADDDDDKLAISNLRKSVMEELKMHDSFVKVEHKAFLVFHAHLFFILTGSKTSPFS